MMSAGGALGGVCVSLVAPLIFSDMWEWQIGLAVCLAISAAVLAMTLPGHKRRRARIGATAAAVALAAALLTYMACDVSPAVEKSRNFYGTVTVGNRRIEETKEPWVIMKHGWVTHGRQFLDPQKRRFATYTYGAHSGIGRTLQYFNHGGNVRVGVVGLGVGTLATYARPGDRYRFYEINPEVLRLARKHFTYLDDCRGRWEVVLGDGRLSLEREPSQQFQLLVLDAFNGDAVPTHLLTAEAFAVYRRHLAPDGAIAVHVTNTYLSLAPVVRGLAENYGLHHVRIWNDGDRQRLEYHSDGTAAKSLENTGKMKIGPDGCATVDMEPELQRLAAVWPSLSAETKRAILAVAGVGPNGVKR